MNSKNHTWHTVPILQFVSFVLFVLQGHQISDGVKIWIAEPSSILLGTKACCDPSFRISTNHLSVTCSRMMWNVWKCWQLLFELTACACEYFLATDETCLRTMSSSLLLTTRAVDVGRFFRIKLHPFVVGILSSVPTIIPCHHQLYLRIFRKLLSLFCTKCWDQH